MTAKERAIMVAQADLKAKGISHLYNAELDRVAEEFCKRIDFEVLAQLFCEHGWHRIELKINPNQYDEVFEWVYDNVKESAHGYQEQWVFESQADANWCLLKWG